MSDASIEDQAALAIVFDENIRDLVRKHLKAALEDPDFMGGLNSYYLSEVMLRSVSPNNINFRNAVVNVITNQMDKF